MTNKIIHIPENPVSRFVFTSTQAAWSWLVVRPYVGYTWLTAGWKKGNSDAWTGENAGVAVKGFMQGALAKAADGKDVSSWYAAFLENFVIPNAKAFAYGVACGAVLVGVRVI